MNQGTEMNFDKLKQKYSNSGDFEAALVKLSRSGDFGVCDKDYLGIIQDDTYYCLGDPTTDWEVIQAQETTEHKIVPIDQADDVVVVDGIEYGIEV